MKKIIIIFFLALFSFSSFSQVCQNPSGVFASPNITSASIFWNAVPNAVGYNVSVGGVGTINATAGQTATTFAGLIPDTVYTYFVQAICSIGQSNPVGGSFRTLSGSTNTCPSNLLITETVSPFETDNQSASSFIFASNIVSNLSTVTYDAGTRVVLRPGFHAFHNSNFRAFIEGCEPTSSNSISSINEEELTLKPLNETIDEVEKTVLVFPNPARNTINVESKDDIVSVQLINQIGNIRAREQSLIDNRKVSLDLSNYPTGIYFLRIIFKDGEVMNKTIVRQ